MPQQGIRPPAAEYILMPPKLRRPLSIVYHFDNFDPCPCPRPFLPDGTLFDGLVVDWPDGTFFNPPFTTEYGSKTAFVRKSIAESRKGKVIYGIISSHGGYVINLLLAAGAKMTPIGKAGRVGWLSIRTGEPWRGGTPTLFFILDGRPKEPRLGRPLAHETPMTPAERQARKRALAILVRDWDFIPPS